MDAIELEFPYGKLSHALDHTGSGAPRSTPSGRSVDIRPRLKSRSTTVLSAQGLFGPRWRSAPRATLHRGRSIDGWPSACTLLDAGGSCLAREVGAREQLKID